MKSFTFCKTHLISKTIKKQYQESRDTSKIERKKSPSARKSLSDFLFGKKNRPKTDYLSKFFTAPINKMAPVEFS